MIFYRLYQLSIINIGKKAYLKVVAKMQAPCSTRNLTIGRLLHDAAQ